MIGNGVIPVADRRLWATPASHLSSSDRMPISAYGISFLGAIDRKGMVLGAKSPLKKPTARVGFGLRSEAYAVRTPEVRKEA